jgi:uncharacterized protein
MAQQFRSEALEYELKKLYALVDGVQATVVVNVDGLLVAAYPPGDSYDYTVNPTGSPQVAAMAATLIGLGERTLARLAQGALLRILMEGDDGTLVIYPAGRVAVAVLVDKRANMGHALYATRRAAREIAGIIGA